MKIELLVSKSANIVPGANIPKTVSRDDIKKEHKLNTYRTKNIAEDILDAEDKAKADLKKRVDKRVKTVMSDFKFGTAQKSDGKKPKEDEEPEEEKEEDTEEEESEDDGFDEDEESEDEDTEEDS